MSEPTTYHVGRRGWVGELALAELVQLMPGFAGLALWLRHVEKTDEPETAATDGVNIFYFKEFAQHPVRVQASIIAHEVLHAALNHPARGVAMSRIKGKRYNHKLMNFVMDAIINEALLSKSWVQFPENAVRLEHIMKIVKDLRTQGGLPTPENDPCERKAHEWSIEALYEFVDQTALAAGQDIGMPSYFVCDVDEVENAQPSKKGIGGDDSLNVTGKGMREDEVFDRMKAWSRRLRGLESGRDTAGVVRGLNGDIPRVRTPWQMIFRQVVTSALSPATEVTWMRPSRRGVFEPGVNRTKPVPKLVVCIDTSGSIDDPIISRFTGELINVNRRTGAQIIVVVADAAVTEVIKPRGFEIMETIKRIRFKGGGGTSFVPALEEAAKHRPDAVVYLTDLYGTFPERKTSFPVFWAVPEVCNPKPEPPFGKPILLI